MRTILIVALVLVAAYPWWGPGLGIVVPPLDSFFEAAYAALFS